MARWTIQRRCCSRHPLMGVRVADFPGVVYVFTMTDPGVHDTDPGVHDRVIFAFTMDRNSQ
ncbi:hypothetical protein CLG94_10870 [Candidatus Methylomirabilis limnetica]|uniref:Uncharacterized protein n=1 Tax=Candidatus Methylomirabilis limnetica TaxID=2033718 RepID=A0A2T4TVS0_9BACT|nr:hypothetical protein [Candidatus Methylomirabilis limnetica]PTL35199.1 hypothetical protein CLG94_10870 [Candidatus Methylomirabilis limnetica]